MRKNECVQTGHVPVLGGVDLMRASFYTHSFSRHFHERYAVGCITRGAMRFRYMGEGMVAPQGQVNLVVPGEAHDGHAANGDGWTYRMFYLQPEALKEAARILGLKHGLPHFRQGVINDPALARCVVRTHMRLADKDVSLLEKETRLLWLLSNWINRYADDRGFLSKIGREHRAAAQAREILAEEHDSNISLTELSNRVELSPFHLVRVFKDEFGITPHAFLTQSRCRAARQSLVGEHRLADIAADCGFSDQAHMTRLFRKQYGITPGRYRKNLQNN